MKKVSGYTHTPKQLNDYANQNNPNNSAYWANKSNQQKQAKKTCNTSIKMRDREARMLLSQVTYDAFENDD